MIPASRFPLPPQGQDALFLETAMHFGKNRHTRIDVVPMDKEVAMDAPLYFRKAISDAEEWTTNHQLLDTTGKGLRRVIPKGFAYFHVGWKGGGFVHPVSPTMGAGLKPARHMQDAPTHTPAHTRSFHGPPVASTITIATRIFLLAGAIRPSCPADRRRGDIFAHVWH